MLFPLITIRDLNVVYELLLEVENGGKGAYARAARSVGLRQSLFNEAINRVEEALGYQLLVVGAKGRRKCEVTPVGAQFLRGAASVLGAWKDASRALDDIAAGQERSG